MVVLGVELSCNQSSTTCPRDVVQCECQVINGTLQWSAMIPGDPQSEDVMLIPSSLVQEYLHLLVHILQFYVVYCYTNIKTNCEL